MSFRISGEILKHIFLKVHSKLFSHSYFLFSKVSSRELLSLLTYHVDVWQSESESEDAQLCLSLSDPMDCSLPGSSVPGIFQARALEWVAISFSKA